MIKAKQARDSGELILYVDKNGRVELRADAERDTLWATQAQIAQVFGCSTDNVSLHLKNIFKDEELIQSSVTEESSVTVADGKKYKVKQYNLDAIIAVGYRVNSKKATKFRIWATKVLHDYLMRGYSIDKQAISISTDKFDDFQRAVEFIKRDPSDGKVKAKMSVRLTKDLIK